MRTIVETMRMARNGSAFLLVTALALSAWAAPRFDAISTVQGSAPLLPSVVCPGCPELPVDVSIFGNGNTFVKYLQVSAGLSVLVRIPETLTADALMETLMRIRTLETEGAAKIAVEVAGDSKKVSVVDSQGARIELPLAVFLSLAGASSVIDRSGNSVDISMSAIDNKVVLMETQRKGSEVLVHKGNHPELAESVRAELGIKAVSPESSIAGKDVLFFAAPTTPVNESLLKTLAETFKLTKNGALVHLVSPYLPYARSDKIDQDGITTGGRLVADLIGAAGARSITYARAHAPQASGFYRISTKEASSYTTLVEGTRHEKIDVFISPDAGAVKDVTKAADLATVPVATINKQRIGKETVMRGITLPAGIPSLEGKRVLVMDDETESGGTLDKAAKEAKRLGAAYVAVAVTHLTGEAKAALNSEAIDAIYVTNSIPVNAKSPKLHVLSLAKEVASRVAVGRVRGALCVRALSD